jgi:hypothetical protein
MELCPNKSHKMPVTEDLVGFSTSHFLAGSVPRLR